MGLLREELGVLTTIAPFMLLIGLVLGGATVYENVGCIGEGKCEGIRLEVGGEVRRAAGFEVVDDKDEGE